MADIVKKEKRSKMMSNIKGKNTKPEMLVRKSLFEIGYRYRLHNNKIPGKPDIMLPKYKVVILVNVCFWHRHDCHLFKLPKTRTEFWKEKLRSNEERDTVNFQKLLDLGYRIATVWECSLKGKLKLPLDKITKNLDSFIQSSDKTISIHGSGKD